MNAKSVFEQHTDLYFPDSDVVLAVQQTPRPEEESLKYTLFCIHKFLLKHHSATFANLFADANTAPTPDVYDGAPQPPLTKMHGDKMEDFMLLLSYLYNPL